MICDGGATSTLTRSLEICTLVEQKVVDIQTAHGATLMSTTHLCLKTYYICDRLGEIRPIVVRKYVVPGLKHDLLSVKGLNESGSFSSSVTSIEGYKHAVVFVDKCTLYR